MTLAAAKYNLPMNTDELLAGIDEEIARLEEVRRLLGGQVERPRGRKPGPKPKKTEPKPKAGKRTMSPEGRARIAAAQKARWAKAKRVK